MSPAQPAAVERSDFYVASPSGIPLAGARSGPPDGPPVVLLHGLTMTRDHVLMGATTLERAGFRVIAYDARGHGRSGAPADPGDYGYDRLCEDLVAVMDAAGVERGLLVGCSMGAHTALRLALESPERVNGLVIVTPAYDPVRHPITEVLEESDRMVAGLHRDGAAGFVAALNPLPSAVATAAIGRFTQRRLDDHRDLGAMAEAIRVNLRDRPFDDFDELAAVRVPALVVASNDELDPRHPFALAEAYARALPSGRLVADEPGRAPLAWNGQALTRHVLEIACETDRPPQVGGI